jgi:predicted enzyme related to lactoylglutathione lyase
MFSLNGRDVGAAYSTEAMGPQCIPPHWGIYISVHNADDAARRAGELGGNVMMQPFDVAEHGRMAVIADPTGAVFSVWQPNQHPGIAITGIDGTVCWADLRTRNTAVAKDFYSQLFGWEIKAGEKDPSGYLHIFNHGSAIGGVPPAQYLEPNIPPHWLLYFLVSDCAAAVERAKGLGATVLMPTMEVPNVGFMAVIKDPQGAAFAFFQAPKNAAAVNS